MVRLASVLIGYVFGLFQTGYLYGRIKGIDIREHGSGNAGATNALRTLGKKAGAITFFGDCFKCVFAVVTVRLLFAGYGESGENMGVLLGMYASMGVILGHNFPFYLNFKGGKGIAATAGLYVSLDPILMLIGATSFVVCVAVTKYVSAGSILVVIELLAGVLIYGFLGKWGLTQPHLYELYGITVFLTLLALYRHKKNIKGLLHGTERKLGVKAE